jgi:hypothetical protein
VAFASGALVGIRALKRRSSHVVGISLHIDLRSRFLLVGSYSHPLHLIADSRRLALACTDAFCFVCCRDWGTVSIKAVNIEDNHSHSQCLVVLVK